MARQVKRRLSAAWLVVIDVLLIAAGVGTFYLYLAVLPQPYEVMAVTTRQPRGRPQRVAALPISPTRIATRQAPAKTQAVTAWVTSAAERAALTTAPSPTPRPSGVPAATAVAASPTRTPSPTRTSAPTTKVQPTRAPARPAASPTAAPVPLAGAGVELGNGKFADKFTNGEVVNTATSYQSSDINVTLTKVQRKGVTYYVQDIYVRYIDNLRTAFAKNTYGRSIAAWTQDIANANGAIGAINGDYYGAGKIGAVIRNGVLYNARPEGDVCVLFSDGTMKVYSPGEFDARQAMAAGAYQAWDFGPGLMTPEGKAIGKFNSGIAGLNPRTAIGYFEPGHYAFVVVDGRQAGYSNGMTLAQLASLFEELGCKAAYNLDGGQTSVMTFGGQVVSRPFRGGRTTSDIIFVGE